MAWLLSGTTYSQTWNDEEEAQSAESGQCPFSPCNLSKAVKLKVNGMITSNLKKKFDKIHANLD